MNDREHVEINLESSARLSASLNAFIVEVIVSSARFDLVSLASGVP